MSYTTYIGNDCHECDEVVDFIKNNNIETRIVNIDQEDETPPQKIYIRPALFKGNDIVAYGSDIIRYFQQ